jgi:hypothetical protein
VAVGVRLTVFTHRVALPLGAPTRATTLWWCSAKALVLKQQLDEPVEIDPVLGNDTADRGRVCGIERGKPGVSPEDAKNADPFMRTDGSPLPLDSITGASDRSREADAVLSVTDVLSIVFGMAMILTPSSSSLAA